MADRENPKDLFGGIFGNYQKMWDQMMSDQTSAMSRLNGIPLPDISKNFFDTYVRYFKDAGKGKNPVEENIVERLSTGIKFYSSVLNWWVEIFKGQFSFPADMANPIVSGPMNQLKLIEAYTNSFSQWADMFTRYMGDARSTGADETKDRITVHMEALLHMYEGGLGRLIKMPSVGPAQYTMERGKDWIDSSIKYQMVLFEYFQNLVQPILRVSADIIDGAKKIIEEDPSEDSVQKLYTMLVDEGEKAYDEFFRSETYLQSMKMTLDAYLDFDRTYNTMMVDMLKGTPIVTKPGLEEVYKEIYLLKKKVRELEKKLAGENRG
jgi:polyhydroxyalkanoate synthesis regulator phasin